MITRFTQTISLGDNNKTPHSVLTWIFDSFEATADNLFLIQCLELSLWYIYRVKKEEKDVLGNRVSA